MKDLAMLVGAVAHDAKVVTLWESLREHFREHGIVIDFALFSTYERQVESLVRGHIDVAWDSAIAHVRVKRQTEGRSRSLAMREIDRDFHSKLLVRRDAAVGALSDLEGKVLAVGSADSAHARILPLHFLRQAGVAVEKIQLLPFDVDVGKHGDTATSEVQALAALHDGKAQAAAVGDAVWLAEQANGHIDLRRVDVLWTTPAYDFAMFDAMPSLPEAKAEAFQRALLGMTWKNPKHRRIFELMGHKQWVAGRDDRYSALDAALAAAT
ncbi:phosphate/phosphite/phosphonate ABC transporter substrate-binding protein [Sorangium sp. So ce1128]